MTESNGESLSLGQKIMDNIFMLTAIGIAFPFLFYFVWGVLEILVFNTGTLSDYLKKSGQTLTGGS